MIFSIYVHVVGPPWAHKALLRWTHGTSTLYSKSSLDSVVVIPNRIPNHISQTIITTLRQKHTRQDIPRCVRTTYPNIFCKAKEGSIALVEEASTLGSYSDSGSSPTSIGIVCGKQHLRRCPHLLEAVHQAMGDEGFIFGTSSRPATERQGTNSKHNQKTMYLGVTEIALICVVNGLVNDPYLHITLHRMKARTPLVSRQRDTRDKRPQLSDAMRVRLGPQAPGKDRPPTAATRETYPSLAAVPITPGQSPHQAL
ncbi:hypothetical protein CK203_060143 [Vitis vinifera]|uniref:Uncharacterized protein n=1 Tax=Vitis vinifera TaxID=29760 RepID=A0A438GMC6_VITVI|nr:hypothetical protein CK203_060143 [Vitis vinifera]